MRKMEKPSSLPQKPAMEGRLVDKKGVDHLDTDFHEKGWDTTPSEEAKQLEAVSEFNISGEEEYAERLAVTDKIKAVAVYQSLSKGHPNHPKYQAWQKRIKELG